jgi:hypothetical protein
MGKILEGVGKMNANQINFLKNMTAKQAKQVIAKFKDDPAIAANKSESAYVAFCQAFEMLNPGEYIQRARFAGGVEYRTNSVYDIDF